MYCYANSWKSANNLSSTLSTHFKMFPKTFQNVSLLYCLICNAYYNIIATLISVGRSKHDIFYFCGVKSPAGVVKVPATASSCFEPYNMLIISQ